MDQCTLCHRVLTEGDWLVELLVVLGVSGEPRPEREPVRLLVCAPCAPQILGGRVTPRAPAKRTLDGHRCGLALSEKRAGAERARRLRSLRQRNS